MRILWGGSVVFGMFTMRFVPCESSIDEFRWLHRTVCACVGAHGSVCTRMFHSALIGTDTGDPQCCVWFMFPVSRHDPAATMYALQFGAESHADWQYCSFWETMQGEKVAVR